MAEIDSFLIEVLERRGSDLHFIAGEPPRIRLYGDLMPLRSFVLPGGTPAAAHLHVARTVCRRAERMMAELADQPAEEVSAVALKYANRLSDFLFVASRYVNQRGPVGGQGGVLWVPGQNR